MEEVIEFFKNITSIQIVSIIIAFGIFLVFRVFSSTIAYAIIRTFKFKEKQAKKIKESALYIPLKSFAIILGIYLAIIYLKKPFNIDSQVIYFVNKAFRIFSIVIFAKGIAESFRLNSTLVNKIRSNLKKDPDEAMVKFILKFIRAIIYAIAGFIVITELGFNLNGLVTGLGVGGVIITLAAQDTAKNVFGGLMVLLDKPFLVGDWIEVGTFEGTVEEITFRSTRVRTFENSVVNIPNSNISNDSIINWSRMEKRRYRTNLCIQLNTPLEKLEKFKNRVEEMLKSREGIYDDSILVKFDEIKDNGLNVLICSYTDSIDYPSYLAEKQDINYKIMKILKEENIELAYDTKTIYIKN